MLLKEAVGHTAVSANFRTYVTHALKEAVGAVGHLQLLYPWQMRFFLAFWCSALRWRVAERTLEIEHH